MTDDHDNYVSRKSYDLIYRQLIETAKQRDKLESMWSRLRDKVGREAPHILREYYEEVSKPKLTLYKGGPIASQIDNCFDILIVAL